MPTTYAPVMLGPVPLDFILFACILLGIAFLHRHTVAVALTGLAVVTIYKLALPGFRTGAGFEGQLGLLAHEWVILANLFALLLGFALLSQHFQGPSRPVVMPRILPHAWN